MNIKKFYNQKIQSRKDKCIAYTVVTAPYTDSTPASSLIKHISTLCKAANAYIKEHQDGPEAKDSAQKAYGPFKNDYDQLFDDISYSDSDDDDETINDDDQSDSQPAPAPTKTKTKKSKKYYTPKVTHVTAEDEKPHKHSTVKVPDENALSAKIRRLTKKVYYNIDPGKTGSNNLRLLLFAEGLSGPSVESRADSLGCSTLLHGLRVYFNKNFGKANDPALLKYCTEQKNTPGVFFVAPVPKSKQAELISKMKKMGVPSREQYFSKNT